MLVRKSVVMVLAADELQDLVPSHTVTECPWALRAMAVARPPILPPAMRTLRPLSVAVAGAAIWDDGIAALNANV